MLDPNLEDALLAVLIVGCQRPSRALVQPALGDLIRERPETQDGKEDCATFTGREDIYEIAPAAPGKSARRVRTINTDPPYGVRYADKNAYLNRTDRGNRIQRAIQNDDLNAEESGRLFQAGLLGVIPYCEPGASCYASAPSGPSIVNFMQAFRAAGFDFKHLLVWVKQQFVIGMADYHSRFEPILYGWRSNGPHYFCGDRSQDSVFEVDRPRINDLHPTCKPTQLFARMIANSSRPGELTFDPFAGSGSSIIAAHQLGRIAFGCEVDAAYVAVILERLSMLGLEPELVNR